LRPEFAAWEFFFYGGKVDRQGRLDPGPSGDPTCLEQERCCMAVTRTVLVIDDDPDIREALQLALEGRGLCVRCAADGLVGIASALDAPPDLVIVDMLMPRASGFVVLERLKQQHRLPVPVIMLTGNDSDHQQAYAESLGVDLYLRKPVRPALLFQAVDRFCPPAGVVAAS
jgi:CheY-like chemotaxis protein